MKRRKKFRKIIDEEYKRLRDFIDIEKKARANFLNEYGKVLPSNFIPQLREPTPTLTMEGQSKDFDIPDLDDIEEDALSYQNGFKSKASDDKVDLETKKKLKEL
jgi:hypothetical protein